MRYDIYIYIYVIRRLKFLVSHGTPNTRTLSLYMAGLINLLIASISDIFRLVLSHHQEMHPCTTWGITAGLTIYNMCVINVIFYKVYD